MFPSVSSNYVFVPLRDIKRVAVAILEETKLQLLQLAVTEFLVVMEPHFNYVGALVFWSYILAALGFTGIILQTLYQLQQANKTDVKVSKGSIWLFSSLALLSFGTLSFNMLNVLIRSFGLWSGDKMPDVLADFPPMIWRWSITSNLFQDFGEAIVANTARFLWVQTSLLVTMSISYFVAFKGKERSIPRLWAFFCLSQILPISFAQNLFYVALSLSPRQGPATYSSKFWSVANVAAYCSCLANAQLSAGTPWLLWTILAARVALFAPLYLAKTEDKIRSPRQNRTADYLSGAGIQRVLLMTASVMAAIKTFQAVQEGWRIDGVWRALFSHPAVSSLGCDLLLSLVSHGAWRFAQAT